MNGEASEKGAKGEIEEIAPGETKSLTLTLQKGHYALVCNLPGHYKAGMRANSRSGEPSDDGRPAGAAFSGASLPLLVASSRARSG